MPCSPNASANHCPNNCQPFAQYLSTFAQYHSCVVAHALLRAAFTLV